MSTQRKWPFEAVSLGAQIILLKDYDPEIIRNFVERVRVYPSEEIEIDMRTSSGFEFVTAS